MIEMIAGVFGLRVEGTTKAMTNKSGPFKASAEQESRLVQLGLARYVDEPEQDGDPVQDEHQDNGIDPIGFDEMPPDPDELPEGVVGIPAYDAGMKVSELREIGRMCGLTFKVGMSKEEMVAALDKHIETNMVDGVEVYEDGEVIVDDGEPAPEFDATEAVL